MNEVDFVRSCARRGQVAFTKHAVQMMKTRKITVQQVFQALVGGAVLEIQDKGLDKHDRILFQGDVQGEPHFYVVAVASDCAVILSACLFKEECWERVGSTMRRKKVRT